MPSTRQRIIPRLTGRSHALLAAYLLASANLWAQTAATVIQAENGVLGAELITGLDGSTQYVTTTTTAAGGSPGSSARVATFTATFPSAGTHELYARLRLGAGGGSDDSFFCANGFDAKSATTDNDWITVNQLFSGRFAEADQIVGGTGSAGQGGCPKWVKLSGLTTDEAASYISAGPAVQCDFRTFRGIPWARLDPILVTESTEAHPSAQSASARSMHPP